MSVSPMALSVVLVLVALVVVEDKAVAALCRSSAIFAFCSGVGLNNSLSDK